MHPLDEVEALLGQFAQALREADADRLGELDTCLRAALARLARPESQPLPAGRLQALKARACGLQAALARRQQANDRALDALAGQSGKLRERQLGRVYGPQGRITPHSRLF